MADIEVFNSEVAAEAWACPIPRIERAVRRALREFCQQTEAWRVTHETGTVTEVSGIDLGLPEDTQLVTLHNLTLDGRPLTAANIFQLNKDIPDWQVKPGTPTHYRVTGSRMVDLVPTPVLTRDDGLHVEYSVKPTLDGRTVDDGLLDQWYEAILHGALGIVLSQKHASWFDRALSQQYTQMFYEAMEIAVSKGRSDHVYRGLVTSYGGL